MVKNPYLSLRYGVGLFVDYDVGSYYRLLHPRPVVVITSTCTSGKVNAMACSWFTPVSEDPPTIAIVIDENAYTSQCIEESKEFVVNVMPVELIDRIWIAGSVSGRNVDKIKEMNVTLVKCRKLNTYAISESLGVIEAVMVDKVNIAGSNIFLGNVVAAYVREGSTGKYGWDLSRVTLPLHGWGRLFYILDGKTKYVYARSSLKPS